MKTKIDKHAFAEFGYYPIAFDITTERFSIQTLSNFGETIDLIKSNPNIQNDWIYSGPALQQNFMSNELRTLPYNARIFDLPKTHVLTLYNNQNIDDLDFVIWCLSFFTGMRLTIKDDGFLDATPIKPGKLVDFVLSRSTLEDVINLALDYLDLERSNLRSTKRVIAAIHVLFLSQYPQNLPFEKFQYLYMALDTCYKLVAERLPSTEYLTHVKRVESICKHFDIEVPVWTSVINEINENNKIKSKTEISDIRNDTIHEALFFDEPLGFSIYGGDQANLNSLDVMLQMQKLVCRLLVAILGKAKSDYVKTTVTNRMCQSLQL